MSKEMLNGKKKRRDEKINIKERGRNTTIGWLGNCSNRKFRNWRKKLRKKTNKKENTCTKAVRRKQNKSKAKYNKKYKNVSMIMIRS